jgi:hypothetical protein
LLLIILGFIVLKLIDLREYKYLNEALWKTAFFIKTVVSSEEADCSFLKTVVSLEEADCSFLKTVVSLEEADCSFLKTVVSSKEADCSLVNTVVSLESADFNFNEKGKEKDLHFITAHSIIAN